MGAKACDTLELWILSSRSLRKAHRSIRGCRSLQEAGLGRGNGQAIEQTSKQSELI